MAQGTKDRASVLQETDDDARRLARILLRSARSCALAVLEPETGFPFATRTLTGIDTDGTPVILVSGLSAHTQALKADPRASLLAGEPGKGDPLAHPRLTVTVRAEEVPRDGEAHRTLRERFIRRHPKAKLYVDFPDFRFFRLVLQRGMLNGGFGKAFVLSAEDLAIRSPARAALAAAEAGAVEHMNSDHRDAAGVYARHYCAARDGDWTLVGIDAAGIDLASGDRLKRLEFEQELESAEALRGELVRLLRQARGDG
ncbi:HugZ family protein [Shinella daejeonensis]|uniref:HugZ family pyridoxamine 5'-phosphate oxidase n=1 Tax=Shinella daejeonensis TaxID=659017 RepID=UPI0020C7B338|nr:HugZ family protein [Shinella daejeonensis]MCP8894036.1 HugZ family protein [Shinella daejeonensis]